MPPVPIAGVPLMTPVELSVTPLGNVLAVENVGVGVPLTAVMMSPALIPAAAAAVPDGTERRSTPTG